MRQTMEGRTVSRRRALGALGLGGLSLIAPSPVVARLAQAACGAASPEGELLGTLPLYGDPGPRPTPFDRIVGRPGLDARRFTDLSRVARDRLVTPTPEVFIRTTAPAAALGRPGPWTIPIDGLVEMPASVIAGDLARRARPMGVHLMECAGNNDPQNFGLMSAVEWDGVPLAEVVAPARPRTGAVAVLVSGVDDKGQESGSEPGASWVLPLDTLDSLGAFLATGMNGAPLPPHHGAPVRLVVPGWYGCAWIKWVDRLTLVDAEAPVTSQMREFTQRTHQPRPVSRARDYEAPVIDLAATAVRVEKRRHDARLFYRVAGLVWGGLRPVDRLRIRFGPTDAWQTFDLCPPPVTHRTWSVWTYDWRPATPGVYSVVLSAADEGIRTRRLDLSYYIRRVRIDAV